MLTPLALGMPQGVEWLFIAGIALLIWGKRLPDVARNMGKGIVEFKKGLKGIEEEVETASSQPAQRPMIEQKQEYKFDPYTGKPLDTTTTTNVTPPSAG